MYSIDGGPPVTFTAYNGTQTAAPDVWSLYQRFFYKEVIPGNHTLTVTVSEVTESQVQVIPCTLMVPFLILAYQVFWIDFITFEGISSTTLIPAAAAKSGFNDKYIGALVAGGIICLIIYSFLRGRYGKQIKACWTGEPSGKSTLS